FALDALDRRKPWDRRRRFRVGSRQNSLSTIRRNVNLELSRHCSIIAQLFHQAYAWLLKGPLPARGRQDAGPKPFVFIDARPRSTRPPWQEGCLFPPDEFSAESVHLP